MNPPYFAGSAGALAHDTGRAPPLPSDSGNKTPPPIPPPSPPARAPTILPTARQRKDDAPSDVDPRSDIKTSEFFRCRQIHHSSDSVVLPRRSATATSFHHGTPTRDRNDISSSRAAGCLPIIPDPLAFDQLGNDNQLRVGARIRTAAGPKPRNCSTALSRFRPKSTEEVSFDTFIFTHIRSLQLPYHHAET